MKEINIDGCEMIGSGAFGKVYRIDDETVVKVYDDPANLPLIETEQARAKRAFVRGIPTAIPFGVVRVGKTYGSVFELLNARNCNDFIIAHPEKIDSIISEYAQLIMRLQSIKSQPGDFPDTRKVYRDYLERMRDYLPDDVYSKLADYLAGLPESFGLVHGDIQMKNVMLSNGEMLLIDMSSMSAGSIEFELGGLFMTYIAFSEYDDNETMDFLGLTKETAEKIYHDTLRLCGVTDSRKVEILGWLNFLAVIIVFLGLRDDDRIAPSVEKLRKLL